MAEVAVASLAYNIFSSSQANREQSRANDNQERAAGEQRKQQRLQNLRTRRTEARKAMRSKAEANQAAASTGAGTSSGSSLAGVTNTATANANSRISFLDTMGALDESKFQFQKQANKNLSNAQDWEAQGQLASTAYTLANGQDSLEKVFA